MSTYGDLYIYGVVITHLNLSVRILLRLTHVPVSEVVPIITSGDGTIEHKTIV